MDAVDRAKPKAMDAVDRPAGFFNNPLFSLDAQSRTQSKLLSQPQPNKPQTEQHLSN